MVGVWWILGLILPLLQLRPENSEWAQQFPFAWTASSASNDSLIWRHPTSEDRYIEVRSCVLCPGGDLWTGFYYSILEQTRIFFVYARASEDPENAPLAIWDNGGPGTSPVSLAFSPATGCILDESYAGTGLRYEPDARRWNKNVNVVFIEEPIGTGFSRGAGKAEEDTRAGAEHIYDFLEIVLSRHPSIPHVSLHSLSYGGHFVPVWAHKIVEENALVKRGISKSRHIPLNRISIGNGWFSADEQYLARFDSLCGLNPSPLSAFVPPLLSASECKRIDSHRTKCRNLLLHCQKENSPEICAAADLWCTESISYFSRQTGRNLFDVSKFSANPHSYDTYQGLARFLNLHAVQVALGVIGRDNQFTEKWEFFNERVSTLHTLAGDHVRRTDILLPELIEAGVDILLYQGSLDIVCGIKGIREVISSQKLVEGPISEVLKDWNFGKGRYLCSVNVKQVEPGKFCYLEIDGAGHEAPIEYEGWPAIFEKWILEGLV
jgi:carboxypeptidase C (cathepsin A)